jgi:hypothetical protein
MNDNLNENSIQNALLHSAERVGHLSNLVAFSHFPPHLGSLSVPCLVALLLSCWLYDIAADFVFVSA